MRLKITLIIAIALILVTSISLTAVHARNAQQVTPCSDEKIATSILTPMSGFVDTFKKLTSAEKADEFAAIITAGIQARQKVGDLSIDPATPCFLAQVFAYNFLNDEIDLATYQMFVKLQLQDASTYTNGLKDANDRIKKDAPMLDVLFSSAPATEAAK